MHNQTIFVIMHMQSEKSKRFLFRQHQNATDWEQVAWEDRRAEKCKMISKSSGNVAIHQQQLSFSLQRWRRGDGTINDDNGYESLSWWYIKCWDTSSDYDSSST